MKAVRPLHAAGLALAITLATAPSAWSRRAPPPGGEVRVYTGQEQLHLLRQSLTTTPLVEPSSVSTRTLAAAWPPMDGTSLRSRFLRAASRADSGVWTLEPSGAPPKHLVQSIDQCFASGSGSWPSRALEAAQVKTRTSVNPEGYVLLEATPSPGSLLELLQGCPGPRGPFVARENGWGSSANAPGGRPYLDAVRLVTDPTEADLVMGSVETGEQLVADWPDSWFLLPNAAAREADPLGLEEPGGWARFHDELAAEIILAVRVGGRGASSRVLLPPGVAPSRGTIGALGAEGAPPLTLSSLGDHAPTLALRHESAPIAGDLAQRLALLLRARGWGVADTADPSARIVRWRSPTSDAALAVLLLSSEFGLPVPEARIPELLDADSATRTGAALTVERGWIESGMAIPLLTAARVITVNPRLQGVRVRGDGSPNLDDAFWGLP